VNATDVNHHASDEAPPLAIAHEAADERAIADEHADISRRTEHERDHDGDDDHREHEQPRRDRPRVAQWLGDRGRRLRLDTRDDLARGGAKLDGRCGAESPECLIDQDARPAARARPCLAIRRLGRRDLTAAFVRDREPVRARGRLHVPRPLRLDERLHSAEAAGEREEDQPAAMQPHGGVGTPCTDLLEAGEHERRLLEVADVAVGS
jgi:hypothetical protein